MSDKRKALMAVVGPERRRRKGNVGCCMICRKEFAPQWLDADEIARGYAREGCLSEPTLTIISCRKCHEISQSWPIEKRIAVVIRWDIDQRTALYNELRGTAPTHVTSAGVILCLAFAKPVRKAKKRVERKT